MKASYEVDSLLGKRFKCPYCKKEHYIPTEMVETKKGAINTLPSLIEKVAGGVVPPAGLATRGARSHAESAGAKNILVLADDITHAVAGQRIQAALKDAGWKTAETVLHPEGTETVHAEEKYLPPILSAARGKDILLTIGAGSITDMGKYAGHISGIPVVSFPTAPSMNAYTSGIAALIKGGVKVTSPVQPPKAVIIDTDIIFGAPIELIRAGFADSMAKCYANADWRLSSILTGEDFCPLPLEMVTASEKKYLTKGRELTNRNEKVISDLMDGLLRGGFSMVIAGTSSPASGGEHLISHYLDMKTLNEGKEPFAYHGLQVGIGVVVAAKIYEKLAEFSGEDVRKRIIPRNEADYRKEVENAFPDSSPVIWREFEKKVPVLKNLPLSLVRAWDEIKEKAFSLVYPQETVKSYLREAGCPIHFSKIGVDKDLAHRTIMNARYIRGRLTILDIAAELGILEEIAGEILATKKYG